MLFMSWMRRHPSAYRFRAPVAKPGDTDLTWDLHGATLSSMVVFDREIVVEYTADTGHWWHKGQGYRTDDPSIGVTGTLDWHVYAGMVPNRLFDQYVETMDRWVEAGTVLRYVAAPDKIGAWYLASDPKLFLPTPPHE